ncbi:MAG: LamG-like jellyroll fold domain-containing protein [Phycisphaerae bacterium]
MKRFISYVLVLGVVLASTATAAVVHSDDYENRTVGNGTEGWHWNNDAVTSHSGEYVSWNGSIVRQHTGTVDSASGTTGRYGFMTDLTMSGNTSSNPEDYTIEFDLVNLSGNWNPISLGLAVTTGGMGYTFTAASILQEDGVVHVSYNLADHTGDWWNGTEWDLTAATWAIEIGMNSMAVENSFTQVFLVDNMRVLLGADTNPTFPVVLPDNDGGAPGNLISGTSDCEITLGWNAGGDPSLETDYPVNPAILGHYIYLSNGSEDPNLYLLDYVEQEVNADPALTEPYNEYGPITLTQSTEYSWKIEEAIDNGAGSAYPAGDVNNIVGPVWTFTTISPTPKIISGPVNALADFDGNASFTVVTGPVATDFQWFKVGSSAALTDSGIYSGTSTKTLLITGATAADEGEYYCIAYNGTPLDGIASEPSATAKLWYPRLVSYYPFETEEGGITPDVVDGFDGVFSQEAESAGMPAINAEMAKIGAGCLELLNSDDSTDPNGNYVQLPAGVADYRDITISAWYQPKVDQSFARLFDFGNGTATYMFLSPRVSWGPVMFNIGGSGDEQGVGYDTGTPAGQWYYVAVTISGDTGRMYINGELISTNTSMTYNPIDRDLVLNYIGKSQYPDPEFDGYVDDMKIWNYALTTEDIAQEYLAIEGGSVCDREHFDLGAYDVDGNCIIDLVDFASFAARWMEDDRIYQQID